MLTNPTTTLRYQTQLQQQQQEVPAAAPAAEPAFDVAAFIAENPPTASEAEAETAEEAPASAEGADPALSDEENEAEAAALAALDGEKEGESEESAAEEDGAEPEAEAEAEETATEHKAIDVKALEAALKAKNPEKFLEALGSDAEFVLGAKAHITLRHAARDVKAARDKLLKASDELTAKFGDPAAIRKAFTVDKDADALVDSFERYTGATWQDIIKFVNESFAGKEARLETKLAQKKADDEAKAKKETEERAANEEKQAKAVVQLKTAITDVVKKQQPGLSALPNITDLVFDKLKAEYRNGVNTPAKALAAVVTDLRAQLGALSKAFAPPAKKSTKTAPAPRETGKRGREMTEEEFIADFLRNNKP